MCVCVSAGLGLPTGLELAIGLCSHNVLGTYNTHARTHALTHAQLACSLGTDCNMRVNAHSAYACASVCVRGTLCVCASVCLLSWRKHIWKICVGDIVVNHRHI